MVAAQRGPRMCRVRTIAAPLDQLRLTHDHQFFYHESLFGGVGKWSDDPGLRRHAFRTVGLQHLLRCVEDGKGDSHGVPNGLPFGRRPFGVRWGII